MLVEIIEKGDMKLADEFITRQIMEYPYYFYQYTYESLVKCLKIRTLPFIVGYIKGMCFVFNYPVYGYRLLLLVDKYISKDAAIRFLAYHLSAEEERKKAEIKGLEKKYNIGDKL